jgi:2'-5' RNA ligase
MEGVVTILSEPYYEMVETIWREVDAVSELNSVQATDIPHFSWHVADSYPESKLASILKETCAEARPFWVRTAGLGIFTAEKCVLYISMVADSTMIQFHKQLWERLDGIGVRASPYYSPGQWVPHITLALDGLEAEELSRAVRKLACRPFIWEMKVDHLAMIGEAGLESGIDLLRFPFGGI